jgi:hypothetical protein
MGKRKLSPGPKTLLSVVIPLEAEKNLKDIMEAFGITRADAARLCLTRGAELILWERLKQMTGETSQETGGKPGETGEGPGNEA